jgi:hypothetical protein
MKSYIVTYDLDRVDSDDNTKVRNALKKRSGWKCTLEAKSGTVYNLPFTTFVVEREGGDQSSAILEQLKGTVSHEGATLDSAYVRLLDASDGGMIM